MASAAGSQARALMLRAAGQVAGCSAGGAQTAGQVALSATSARTAAAGLHATAACHGVRAASTAAAAAGSAAGSGRQQLPPPGSPAAAVLDGLRARGVKLPDALRSGADAASAASASASAAGASAAAPPENPYVSRIAYPDNYVTRETNPARHTFAHVGRYYSLGDDEAVKGLAPGGMPGGMQGEFDFSYSNSLQIRPTGVSLVAQLENWRQTHGRRLAAAGKAVKDIDPSKPYAPLDLQQPLPVDPRLPPSVAGLYDPYSSSFHPAKVLTGPAGVGKSGVLAYVLHYARTNGWLAVSVPDCHRIMYMGKVLVKSKRRPGMVDQHDMALDILRDVAASQPAVLASIPQRGRYAKFRYLPGEMDKRVTAERNALKAAEEAEMAKLKAQADAEGRAWDPSTFVSKYEDETDMEVDRSGFTLQDMVEWGIRHPSAAVDTLLDFLAEARQVTEVPVVVLVDGLNHLYGPSDYAVDGKDLTAEQLSVPAAFRPFNEAGFDSERYGMKRGLWLASVSFRHHQNMDATLFGKARVRGAMRTPVPPMGRLEMYAMLRHYKACGYITELMPYGMDGGSSDSEEDSETEEEEGSDAEKEGAGEAGKGSASGASSGDGDDLFVPTPSNRFLMLSDAVLPHVDPFAVEYYRVLTSGRPGEVKRAIVFTPDPEHADSLKKMRRRREERARRVKG